ncbi:hypothetical protein GCM10022409_08370 [Hymenobacter glaciei]|uniref:DUF4262 domain-containing protein n=1 Tax=Hymenobacter glaciei TaxID=877209 RepID=A0ABP7TIN7_9BACT
MNDLVPIETVSWEELQQYVYEVDGSWRDIYVLGANRADWEIWADFVNANYRVKFIDGNSVRHNQIDFTAVESFWDSDGPNMPISTFFVGEVNVNCYFFGDYEIENDIDPLKITSYAVHQQLMDYLTRLSQALGKEVVLTLENDTPQPGTGRRQWHPLLAVNGEQIMVYPYWLGSK